MIKRRIVCSPSWPHPSIVAGTLPAGWAKVNAG
jgi:hypothetical protein